MNRRTFLLGGLSVIGMAAGGGFLFTRQEKFGRLPSGARLARIQASPHYVNGRFECLEPVEILADKSENRVWMTVKFFMQDKSALFPKQPMISQKTDLLALPPSEDVAVWMGHSSYYLQLGGQRVLIDPVFSSYASPIFFINKAFPGSNIYAAEDFPEIDVLAITHDHWDHLDYASVTALRPKIRHVVCPLGVGAYFEQWGFDPTIIHEEDWNGKVEFGGLTVHILPSQHFSGRFIYQNPTEWCAFAFTTKKRRVFCSGDGGYGKHFTDIGARFGGFDLAIMENGQYNQRWHQIHLLPEQTAQAALDVRAARVLPSHNGKFALAMHAWDEPYRAITAASEGKPYKLLTPKIGELVRIGGDSQRFDAWWEKME